MVLILAPDSPPINVSARTTSPNSISVEWDEVNFIDRNGIITQYDILYDPQQNFSGRIMIGSVDTTGRTINLTLLEAYVNYTIFVRANTFVGAGPYSAPITILTMEDSKESLMCDNFV